MLAVEARDRPQPNSGRFLLDVHLGTLARRCGFGIDAAYEPGSDDSQLATRSTTEQRELLTRDRGLLFRKAVYDGALLRSGDVEVQLAEVLGRFPRASRPGRAACAAARFSPKCLPPMSRTNSNPEPAAPIARSRGAPVAVTCTGAAHTPNDSSRSSAAQPIGGEPTARRRLQRGSADGRSQCDRCPGHPTGASVHNEVRIRPRSWPSPRPGPSRRSRRHARRAGGPAPPGRRRGCPAAPPRSAPGSRRCTWRCRHPARGRTPTR